MTFDIDLYNGNEASHLSLQAERVDIKFTREPFEYKRKETRRVNDRGFMTTVFVITGYYKGTSEADATTFLANFQTAMKKFYEQDLCKFSFRCGDGTNTITATGANCWHTVIKSGDIKQSAETPNAFDYVITLLEGQ